MSLIIILLISIHSTTFILHIKYQQTVIGVAAICIAVYFTVDSWIHYVNPYSKVWLSMSNNCFNLKSFSSNANINSQALLDVIKSTYFMEKSDSHSIEGENFWN